MSTRGYPPIALGCGVANCIRSAPNQPSRECPSHFSHARQDNFYWMYTTSTAQVKISLVSSLLYEARKANHQLSSDPFNSRECEWGCLGGNKKLAWHFVVAEAQTADRIEMHTETKTKKEVSQQTDRGIEPFFAVSYQRSTITGPPVGER